MRSLSLTLTSLGLAYLTAMVSLAITQAPLGTPMYFALAGVGVSAYVLALRRVWVSRDIRRGLFFSALAFALFFRVPLAISPVSSDNDMIRYLWDGRVQRLGINPYLVLPADPELTWTHTPETRQMPSARQKTPYPPAAQLFFRLVVSVHDSSLAMKLALVICDLLTILVVWRWLVATGRNEWLTLAYAWNPLVVLEVGYSGHIDALGALWISAAAWWLARRRTALATIAFVLAVATKILPVVLVPLFWRRITTRDAVLGTALFVLLYLPFSGGPQIALGGVTRVVEHIRFNGPVFHAIRALSNPVLAGATAVGLGLLVAVWCRWRLGEGHPASWAWPMAIALACAPVVYPWYLLYVTPFLVTASTLPLTAWTMSVIPVYVVWEISRNGGRWVVPPEVLIFEFAVVMAAVGAVVARRPWRGPVIPAASRPTG
jgi:hypothetical protein